MLHTFARVFFSLSASFNASLLTTCSGCAKHDWCCGRYSSSPTVSTSSSPPACSSSSPLSHCIHVVFAICLLLFLPTVSLYPRRLRHLLAPLPPHCLTVSTSSSPSACSSSSPLSHCIHVVFAICLLLFLPTVSLYPRRLRHLPAPLPPHCLTVSTSSSPSACSSSSPLSHCIHVVFAICLLLFLPTVSLYPRRLRHLPAPLPPHCLTVSTSSSPSACSSSSPLSHCIHVVFAICLLLFLPTVSLYLRRLRHLPAPLPPHCLTVSTSPSPSACSSSSPLSHCIHVVFAICLLLFLPTVSLYPRRLRHLPAPLPPHCLTVSTSSSPSACSSSSPLSHWCRCARTRVVMGTHFSCLCHC